jgi:hypothetical protein
VKSREPTFSVDPRSTIATWLDIAAQKMASAPPAPWVSRPQLRPELVARFVLPLSLCPTSNTTSRAVPVWVHTERKRKVWESMVYQEKILDNMRPKERLKLDRPQVIAVRFAIKSCDSYSDFAKAAVDMLKDETDGYIKIGRKRVRKPVPRLGYLRDDSPQFVELHQWWEPVKKRAEEFVYIEVRA